MKSRIIKNVILTVICLLATNLQAQIQTDPILTGTVATGDVLINSAIKEGTKKQQAIIGLNGGILLQLEQIREYEKTMYKYLSETQSIINNAYEIVKCGELLTNIYSNLSGCTDAVVGHPQGAVISVIISKQYSRLTKEVLSLYGYVNGLVTKSGNSNLLNSAERMKILTNVTGRLSTINRNLQSLKYQIQIYRWSDIPRVLAPKEYYSIVNCDLIAKQIKRDIDRMSNK